MPAALQFKLTLRDVKPAIWRRIRVSSDLTFSQLHYVIQILFGWDDCHLWQFDVAAQTYADHRDEFADSFGGPKQLSAKKMSLGELPATLDRFGYWYDFGDDWRVIVAIESRDADLPNGVVVECVTGARSGPPDDVGGPFGYPEFLQAISNPDHEEHEGMLEWIGGAWDAEAFSPQEINREFGRWAARAIRRKVTGSMPRKRANKKASRD